MFFRRTGPVRCNLHLLIQIKVHSSELNYKSSDRLVLSPSRSDPLGPIRLNYHLNGLKILRIWWRNQERKGGWRRRGRRRHEIRGYLPNFTALFKRLISIYLLLLQARTSMAWYWKKLFWGGYKFYFNNLVNNEDEKDTTFYYPLEHGEGDGR